MYDSIAFLMAQDQITYDAYGNEVITYTENMVYVKPTTIYASEFYAAAQAGMHPSISFVISNRADYAGEKLIKWNDKIYSVIRVDWKADRDAIKLICEEKIGDVE